MLTAATMREHIINQAIVLGLTLLLSYGLAWLCYGFLHIVGKHTIITEQKRKYFFAAATAVLFVFLLMYERMDSQLEALRSAAPQQGRLHVGILSCRQLADAQVHDLDISLPTTNSFTISSIPSGKIEKGVNFLVILQIVNSGQPTAVLGWKAYAILPGGSKVEAFMPSMSDIDETILTVTGPIRVRLDNNLLQAFSEKSLETGGSKIGWLPLHFNGLTKMQYGTKFVITVWDAFGHQTKLEHVWDIQ